MRRRAGRAPDVGKRALAAAVFAHAALLAGLVVMPRVHRTPSLQAPRADEPVPIELVESNGAPAESGPEATNVGESAAPPERSALGSASVAIRDTRRAPSEVAAPEPSAGPTAPTTDFVMPAVPEAHAAIGLELGAPNRFVQREAPPAAPTDAPAEAPYGRPRTNAEAKAAAEAALRAPARQRERDLGLGPEGPVLAALGEAASASTAPIHGRAVFVAVADGTGMIVGIDVVECDGARAGWANAAALARTALKGKKLRMPSTATRAEMRIELTSEWKLPSGHDPGVDVELFHVPVGKGEGKQSTKVAILDPIPKIRTVDLAPDVKVPIPVISVDILAVQGDPADIGAKPRRIVHTRLLDSKVL